MKTNKRYAVDMVNGPLASKILLFALPFMAANIMQLLFNAADVVVVGKFAGDISQAAVTSTGSLINLLIGLFTGLGVGINVVVARTLGGGDHGRVGAVVHTSITVAILCGILLTLIGELFAPAMLHLMGSPGDVIGLSVIYLRFYFLGLPAAMVYNFGSALLRAQGDTKRPMYYLTIAGVVNVVLNLIFVVGFHWDVAGVAEATAISKYIAGGLVLWCLYQENGIMRFEPRQLGIDWAVLKDIARIGLPAGLQGTLFSLSNVTVQSSVNSLGAVVMAGSGAAANIGGIFYTMGNSFYQAAMTFASQNYGAGKMDRVNSVHRWCLLYGMAISVFAGVLAMLFGEQMLSIYTNEAAVIEQGMIRVSIVNTTYCLSAFMEVNSGMLRGVGCSVMPMLIALLGTCVFRVGWVATVFQSYGTPESLYLCYPVSWLVTGAAHLLYFFIIRRRLFDKMKQKEN